MRMTISYLLVMHILLPLFASQYNPILLEPQVYADATVDNTSTLFSFKYDNTKANAASTSNYKYNFGIVFYDQINYTVALAMNFSSYTYRSGEQILSNGTDFTEDLSLMVINIRYIPTSALYYLNLTFNMSYLQAPVRFAVVANEDDLSVRPMIFQTNVKQILAKAVFQGTYPSTYHSWQTFQIRVNTSTYLKLKYSKCIGDISVHFYDSLNNSLSGANPLNTISPVIIDGSRNFPSTNASLINQSTTELYMPISQGIYYIVIKGISGVATMWGASLYAFYSLSTSTVDAIPSISLSSDALLTLSSFNYTLTNRSLDVTWNNTITNNLTSEDFWQNYSPLYYITLAGHPVVAQFEAQCSGLTFPSNLPSQTMLLPLNYWNNTLIPYPLSSEELQTSFLMEYQEDDMNFTGIYVNLALKVYPQTTNASALTNIEPYVTFFYTRQQYWLTTGSNGSEETDTVIGVTTSIGGVLLIIALIILYRRYRLRKKIKRELKEKMMEEKRIRYKRQIEQRAMLAGLLEAQRNDESVSIDINGQGSNSLGASLALQDVEHQVGSDLNNPNSNQILRPILNQADSDFNPQKKFVRKDVE